MEIQMPMVASTSATAAATTGGTSQAVAGTSSAAAGQSSFSLVLGGQMTQQDGAAEATDPAVTLAGLLQMLQSLTLPIQNIQSTQDEQGNEQQLPELLLQAMNGNEALSNQLLQDAGLQQWFANAADLLSALSDAQAGNNQALLPQARQVSTLSLQAQSTLLLLSTMLEKQPSNPFLQHLVQDLQKVMQPLLPMLTDAAVVAEGSTEGNHDILTTLTSDVLENTVAGTNANGEQSGKQSGHGFGNKRDVEHLKSNEMNAAFDVEIVKAPKSKLELLAARNAINASFIQTQTVPQEVHITSELVIPQEGSAVDNTIIGLADAFKANQTEQAVKATSVPMSANNFAEEMTQHVLKNMKITLNEGISEAKLSLFPKNLGHVDVRITMHEGQLIAQFATDTLAGKQMLESQMSQLRQALISQGLQVEKLEVTQNQSMQSGMFQDQRQQQQFKQSSQPNKNNVVNYDQESSEFVQELSGAALDQSHVNGNSFDVIA